MIFSLFLLLVFLAGREKRSPREWSWKGVGRGGVWDVGWEM